MQDIDEQDIDQVEIDRLDEVVRRVAAKMPFPVDLEADMGGTFVQQIMLGRRGGVDDPPDRATIDPGNDSVWWLDVEGGRESIESTLTRDADPSQVAEWIAAVAREWGSPAAIEPPARSAESAVAPLQQFNDRLRSLVAESETPRGETPVADPGRQVGPSL